MRLERGLQLCRRLELELDRHLGGRERRLGVAAGVVGRVGREALLVDRLLRVDHVRAAPRCRARAPAHLPRAASGVSAATTAIGWPAYTGSDDEDGVPRRQRELALRPDHGPDAVGRAGRVEVERAHAPVRDGRAEHGRVEHARETDVGRVAHAPGRPELPVEARRGLADERKLRPRRDQFSTSSASSTSAQTSS